MFFVVRSFKWNKEKKNPFLSNRTLEMIAYVSLLISCVLFTHEFNQVNCQIEELLLAVCIALNVLIILLIFQHIACS